MSQTSHRSHPWMSLSPEDAQVLDQLLTNNPGESADVSQSAARGERLSQVLALLDQCPAEDPPAELTDRTLQRIREARQSRRFAQQIEVLSMPRSNFGWYELGAVAASLLIMASLALPMVARNQDQARRTACANGMQSAAVGFGNYGHDHQNVLPRGPVAPGASWFNIGMGPAKDGGIRSNSSHLYILVRNGYLNPKTLSCPENQFTPKYFAPDAADWQRHEETSYSYQNQFTAKAFRIDRKPQMAVLADKNPLFVIVPGQPLVTRNISPDSPSELHKAGQNVLTADGVVAWQTTAMRSGNDSMWTISGVPKYTGTETPTDPDDSHLVP